MSSDATQSAGGTQTGMTRGEKIQSDPKLPHERDQMQGQGETRGVQPGARDIIQQAHDDIEGGQQDTDLHDQRTLEDTTDK